MDHPSKVGRAHGQFPVAQRERLFGKKAEPFGKTLEASPQGFVKVREKTATPLGTRWSKGRRALEK